MENKMKLKESIPSNSVKIIELYNKIDSEILDTSPDFQRKLVWKKHHKYSFIETILMNFPFPEVYIASSEIDVKNKKYKEIVVDGKQRLTAIVEYIKGINDFEFQNKISSFEDLEDSEKKDFLNYLVTVKDLKDMDYPKITDVFQRINSTEYSLNANERLNALFGDGEFALFCKQIVDSNFNPFGDETDIVLKEKDKIYLNTFFTNNQIFSENDISRMFDVQYIMLIVSTLLEGEYFGRSLKINEYLEKYNSTFSIYQIPLEYILNSLEIINKFKFSEKSYWYNKANLFTLIIEFAKINKENIDFEKLEQHLLEFETKVDLYFSDDESINISDDEKKYFEVARQGSHEKSSRIHRGKIIKNIIKESLITNEIENKNITVLDKSKILFSILIPTETGLTKGIMDAVSGLREFLKTQNYHNYETQPLGPNHKVIKSAKFKSEDIETDTKISLYRSNGRGDYRIWFADLKKFADPKDELAITIDQGILKVLNLSKFDYSGIF
jgi:Protein of unknown function DUF262